MAWRAHCHRHRANCSKPLAFLPDLNFQWIFDCHAVAGANRAGAVYPANLDERGIKGSWHVRFLRIPL